MRSSVFSIISKVRSIIENMFGILVSRWRIFCGPIGASRDNVLKYTLLVYIRQTENACTTQKDSLILTMEVELSNWESDAE